MPGNVTLSTANVPEGTCPAWFTTEFWASKVALITANLNGSQNVINYGSATPSPGDISKPWWRKNTDGSPDKIYDNYGGVWVSRHTMLPGSRIIAPPSLTTAAQIWAWDGGDGSNPATTSPTGSIGAMWEIDPDLEAKFPLGTGVLPSTTLVSVGDTGGEENHLLVTAELPAHSHNVLARNANVSGGSDSNRLFPDTDPAESAAATTSAGGDMPHNTMPLWRGVMFIRRTARLFYTP